MGKVLLQQVTLRGKTYPFRVTMGAMLRFKRLTGRDASSIKPDDLESLVAFFYCCLASACNADGVEWPYTSLEQFEDSLSVDELEEMNALMAQEGAGDSKKKEKSSRA